MSTLQGPDAPENFNVKIPFKICMSELCRLARISLIFSSFADWDRSVAELKHLICSKIVDFPVRDALIIIDC